MALAAIGAALGIALWYLLIRHERRSPYTERELFRTLLITGLALHVMIAVLNPTFNSPDEQAHFNYVKYLYEQQAMPVKTTVTNAPTNDWEYHQPPLYYLALTPLYAVTRQVTTSVHVQCVVLRLASVVFWLIAALSTIRLLNGLNIISSLTRTLVVAMICLLPAWLFLSSSINNDILLVALAALMFERLTRSFDGKNAAILGVLAGLALLTKTTGLLVIMVFGIVLLLRMLFHEIRLSTLLARSALAAGIALALWSPVLWWNVVTYGNVIGFGAAVAEAEYHWPSIFHAFRDTTEYLKESFWSACGIYNKARFLPSLGVHLSYLAVIGLAIGAWRRRRNWREVLASPENRTVFALGIGVALVTVIVVLSGVYRTLFTSHGQGRFLFPYIAPIGILLGYGLRQFGVERWRHLPAHTAGFFLAYSVTALFYSFGFFGKHVDLPWYR